MSVDHAAVEPEYEPKQARPVLRLILHKAAPMRQGAPLPFFVSACATHEGQDALATLGVIERAPHAFISAPGSIGEAEHLQIVSSALVSSTCCLDETRRSAFERISGRLHPSTQQKSVFWRHGNLKENGGADG
jgi:hypothetical protein